MNYEKILDEIFFSKRINRNNYNKFVNNLNKYSNIYNFLYLLYNKTNNVKELIYRLHNKDYCIKTCKTCGKMIDYFSISQFCSNKCRRISQVQLTKQNLINKYGVDNVAKLETTKEKMKQTCLQKYGFDYSLQSKEVKNKSKQTCIEKYGVDNCAKSNIIKEKINNTKIHKYGYINNFCNKEILNKAIHNSTSENAIIKRKKTLLKKYGVDNFSKSKLFYNSVNWNLKQLKSDQTKRKNNSFNKSQLEDESYKLLKEKYPNIIRQYKSKLYPFACDFYIPNYNDNKIDTGLYIECNYHWTHGNKIFEGTIDDNIKLKKWKFKKTKYYDNAIYTWTILDPKKLKTFKENKLNYLIFYNIDEFNNWLNKKEED